ncbi:hypothetical protein JIG36_13800 [Actinoplanes sp. LDG1-06]|uniref:Uncharacterized protein n=1 Tax=Paractinoplanes ovalisporus TaxID=2810368 RepID=A0ABS2A9X1_9ACTN|nr:hypothetical protein [Actinoplanes ovalisporus]MBM2616634.1 hypothetical protein [Actinoplanes ovalisporus]
MIRKFIARFLAVVTIVATSIFVLGSPAWAFRRWTTCFNQELGDGQKIRFYADNGDILTTVDWYWRFAGQGNAKYMIDISDFRDDGADTSVRVDAGSGVFEYTADKVIGYNVVKYRVVWNGYATAWLTPGGCFLLPIDPS